MTQPKSLRERIEDLYNGSYSEETDETLDNVIAAMDEVAKEIEKEAMACHIAVRMNNRQSIAFKVALAKREILHDILRLLIGKAGSEYQVKSYDLLEKSKSEPDGLARSSPENKSRCRNGCGAMTYTIHKSAGKKSYPICGKCGASKVKVKE